MQSPQQVVRNACFSRLDSFLSGKSPAPYMASSLCWNGACLRVCVCVRVCRGKRKVSMCTDLYLYDVSLDMGAVVGRRPYPAPCVHVCVCACVCVCRGKRKVSMCTDFYFYDVSLDMGAVKPRRNELVQSEFVHVGTQLYIPQPLQC